ncbi:zinc ribbon-containing protein [Simiduia agarivorans]|uniref:Uncharacterized protein n=1 Tax=Simiduia agarivorans (strain DSM 21679 / JCM 13881 / BCRC 17597 / SA1) TaxID=1117647 RepID=K4KN33_SIMAS|nr:zinc ribbon-containing protein [Simiduia agarivorans]AFV00585.1 hypothetical protein M5M_17280 [Simiduia agarivorans SA1 = DSM 21679]
MAQKRESAQEDHWQQALNQGVEGFVKLELAAEDMVKDEASLVRAWLSDDAHAAGRYLSGLAQDINTLEQRAGAWMLSAADPFRAEWLHLSLCLGHSAEVMVAGEKPGGVHLACAGCGQDAALDVARALLACEGCGGQVFRRKELTH